MTFLVLSGLFVYQLRRTRTVLKSCTDKINGDTYLHALSRAASPDGYIILALVDVAFVDMAINLYETSLRPNDFNNFLFVGVGDRVCQLLNASLSVNPVPCYHYADDAAADRASVYMSSDFIRKMNIRTDMIIEALNARLTVVHVDLDVVFFRNWLPHIKVAHLHPSSKKVKERNAYSC